MPGGRATTRHADSALRSTKRAACAAAVGPERRDDERLRHERKLVDGRDPIGFRRASVIGVIGEWAFDHRRIGRSTAGLGRHLPQHKKSGWYETRRCLFRTYGRARRQARAALQRLLAKPELNGQQGIVVSHDDATGRCSVKLSSGGVKALKPNNLEPSTPSSSSSMSRRS